jgi:hypothetical protein
MASRASAMTWLEDIGAEADRFAFEGALRMEGIGGGGGTLTPLMLFMLLMLLMLEKDGAFWYCRRTPWAGFSGSPRPGGPDGRSGRSIRSMLEVVLFVGDTVEGVGRVRGSWWRVGREEWKKGGRRGYRVLSVGNGGGPRVRDRLSGGGHASIQATFSTECVWVFRPMVRCVVGLWRNEGSSWMERILIVVSTGSREGFGQSVGLCRGVCVWMCHKGHRVVAAPRAVDGRVARSGWGRSGEGIE